MSRFEPVTLKCPNPKCGAPVRFAAVSSVNADRRPDLREEILAGSFQREACTECKTTFRLEPEFSYVDLGRGAWVAVHAPGRLSEWQRYETEAKDAFKTAYGAKATAPAQKLGKKLSPRVVFGWAALREKLVAAEGKLDDVELELTKMAILRGSGGLAPGGGVELRLAEVQGDMLAMGWIRAKGEEMVELIRTPRSLYDEVAADKKGWKDLRDEFDGAYFVDAQRLLVG